MSSQKGDTRQPFNAAVQDTQPTRETPKPVAKMVRDDQPVPRPKPPAMGQAVDAQNFNQRWQQQVDASNPLDPFDAIDEQQQSLQAEFMQNTQATKIRGLEQA